MRKPALYGLVVVCASLLFTLSGSFGQALQNGSGGNSSTPPATIAVDALGSCDLDNRATSDDATLIDSLPSFSTTAAGNCIPNRLLKNSFDPPRDHGSRGSGSSERPVFTRFPFLTPAEKRVAEPPRGTFSATC